jgi:hypothetical protein
MKLSSSAFTFVSSLALFQQHFFSIIGDKNCVRRRGRRFSSGVSSSDCNDQTYDLELEVSGSSGVHVYFFAKPTCTADSLKGCECPSLAFDSVELPNGNLDNAIHEFEKQELDLDKETLKLGSYISLMILMLHLMHAHHWKAPSMGLLHHLGIDATDRTIITFVCRHLSNDSTIDALEKNDVGADLILANSDTDAAIIEEFVSAYIHARV